MLPSITVLLLLPLALAAERVELPADEPPAAWTAALAAAGLVAVQASEDADAILQNDGSNVDIRLRSGQRIQVARPKTAAARADLAMLVASLVEPADTLGWGAVPAAQPTLPATTPSRPPVASARSVPRAPARPVAIPPAPLALPLPQADLPINPLSPSVASRAAPVVAELPAPATTSARKALAIGAWTELGISGQVRSDVAVSPGLSFGGGAQGRGWRAGFRARLGEETALTSLSGDRSLRSTSGALGAWVHPSSWFEAGLLGGAELRTYNQEGSPVADAVVPTLGLELRARVPLAGPLSLVPAVGGVRDLRSSVAQVGDTSEVALSPWALSAGISVLVQTRDQEFSLRPL